QKRPPLGRCQTDAEGGFASTSHPAASQAEERVESLGGQRRHLTYARENQEILRFKEYYGIVLECCPISERDAVWYRASGEKKGSVPTTGDGIQHTKNE